MTDITDSGATPTAPAERPVSRKARELNEEIRYTSWSVFKAVAELPSSRRTSTWWCAARTTPPAFAPTPT
jgi:hypothetical protein